MCDSWQTNLSNLSLPILSYHSSWYMVRPQTWAISIIVPTLKELTVKRQKENNKILCVFSYDGVGQRSVRAPRGGGRSTLPAQSSYELTYVLVLHMQSSHCLPKVNSPFSAWDMFQDPKLMPETVDSTELYIYYNFFPMYTHL